MMAEVIIPNTYVALRLPSDTHSILQVKPNTTIHIGKYGHFQANHIIGRPYYLTFEIFDREKQDANPKHGLRIVPASELHSGNLEHDVSTPSTSEMGEAPKSNAGVQYDILGDDGQVIMRTNQHITDDQSSQILSMEEIEALKASSTDSGKDLVAKILASHSALDKKTAFALAKYTLRKTKKYLKRFTVLPLDVGLLAKWTLHEKDAGKIMELREEVMSLIRSWSNVHYTPELGSEAPEETARFGGGRWLVVDETAGLLTAYMAEQMGLLHQQDGKGKPATAPLAAEKFGQGKQDDVDPIPPDHSDQNDPHIKTQTADLDSTTPSYLSRHPLPLETNTLTVLHPLSQPNLSLLHYFNYDVFNPPPTHPLTAHLRTLSWLQLLDPHADNAYRPPPRIPESEIQTWKPAKRGNHYRKLRRWQRTKTVVDSTRAGGFDGLVIASVMQPASILHHLVTLLRGSAQVVVYSPHLEPLSELADYYSTARKTAFLNNPIPAQDLPTDDFPVDPRLLLAPSIQTVRVKPWQVLPGRTHPLMTGRGGADGYVFSGTRVLPATGVVKARGNFMRKRKVETKAEKEGVEERRVARRVDGSLELKKEEERSEGMKVEMEES